MLDTQPDSRYDRPVYFGPGCDVAGADMIGVIRKTAFDADELGLTLPVRLVDGSTLRACLARVSGINSFHGYAFGESLVADKRPELPECPRMNGCALVLTNGYPVADACKVFKGNAAFGVFGLTHNRFADDVIRVGLKPLLLPSELLEMSLRASSSSRLKTCSELGYTGTNSENLVPRMGFAVRVEGEVTDSKVNPEPALDLPLLRIRDVHRNEKVEATFSNHEIGFSSVVNEKFSLMVSADEGDSLSSTDRPDAHRLPNPGENTGIVGDGTKGTEGSLSLSVQLVAVSHLGDAADNHLGREIRELSSTAIVGEPVEGKLTEGLGFPRCLRQPVTSLICSTDRRSQRRRLLSRRLELDLHHELHTFSVGASTVEVKPRSTISSPTQEDADSLPPLPEGRGFRSWEPMKSKGDPILDLQAICQESPVSEADLKEKYKELGWGPPFEAVLEPAKGTYIVKGEDGLYRPRNGTTKEVVDKVLRGERT